MKKLTNMKKLPTKKVATAEPEQIAVSVEDMSLDEEDEVIFYFNATLEDLTESESHIHKNIAEPINMKKIGTQRKSNNWLTNGIVVDPYRKNNYRIDEVDNWPATTNILCWRCTRSFSTMPIGLPYKYLGGVFYTKGCFCSGKCAAGFNHDDKNSNKWEIASLLFLMMKMINLKITENDVSPSPPKEVLVEYGGRLTHEEYQKIIESSTITKVDMILPPMVSIGMQCEKIEIPKNNTAKILSDKDKLLIPLSTLRQSCPDKKLRITRKKPLGNGKTTILEKFVKIDERQEVQQPR
jgi:hypothetical protein